MDKTSLLVLFMTLLVSSVFSQDIKRKICATSANDAACQQISRKHETSCNVYLHQVDCMLSISNNQSQIGRISGEAALLGASPLTDNVIVLGEIFGRHEPSSTVVIVKTDIPNGFVNLKGKKYCHPGFKHEDLFSHWMLQEFENTILQLNETYCSNENITLLESSIRSLHDFFGNSCRPGPWTQYSNFDRDLKSRYSYLCSLCGSALCDVDYKSPFNDSLKCLINNDADVAVTTLLEGKLFFASSQNAQKYKYLCSNGTSTSSTSPCIWSSQLRDLLVAERSIANDIKTFLQTYLPSKINNSQSATDSSYLINILNLRNSEQIQILQYKDHPSIIDYVKERRIIPTIKSSKRCSRTFKWCTKSEPEQRKCEWLSQAAINWAIQPVVECKQASDTDELSCLDDVKRKSADITVTSSDYAYMTLKKGLKAIAYPESSIQSVILAVKKADDNSINTFKDLKGKKACFPRFGGKEHLALIDTTIQLKVTVNKNCDYGFLLNDFIGDSCVPGVRSSVIKETTEEVDKDKLCNLCVPVNVTATATYCNADEINKYFGDDGAVKCLREDGDFAVISQSGSFDKSDLRVICKNNTLASTNGIQVDRNCALNVITSSEVVSLVSNEMKSDITLALYEFERWFGKELKKTFHLFDGFNGTLDLLFKDSTPGLNFDNNDRAVENYKQMLDRVKECNSNSSSNIHTAKVSLIALLIVFITFKT